MTETQIRLSVFLGMLILMGALEALFPARDRRLGGAELAFSPELGGHIAGCGNLGHDDLLAACCLSQNSHSVAIA